MIKSFRKDQSGAAFLEFAAILSICILIIMATIEISHHMWQARQVEKLANDLTSILQAADSSTALSTSDQALLETIIDQELSLSTDKYHIIIHSISYDPVGPGNVLWTFQDGTLTATSNVSPNGIDLAELPSGATSLESDESVLTIEIFWHPSSMSGIPLFSSDVLNDNRQIYLYD